MLRVFGKNKLYLKNADVIERLAAVDTIIFDKTGTVTRGRDPKIAVQGSFEERELSAIKVLTSYSTHPLSKLITKSLSSPSADVSDFKEIPGKGIQGAVDGIIYRIGSALFTNSVHARDNGASRVFVSIDGIPRGHFTVRTSIRENVSSMIARLGQKCRALLSGDRDSDRDAMREIFGHAELLFDQSPQDKLRYIADLQRRGKKVLMIGDGLNDAGALKQSDVGIAISEDSGVFTPASDGILYADNLQLLDKFLALARLSTTIVKAGFAISFVYNAIALGFAVSGHLTPLVAAILMPISSISVVSFTTLAVNFSAKKKLGNIKYNDHEIYHR
jgi:Cu+-exporting ATPase